MDLLTELARANHDPAVIAQVRALMEQSARAEQMLAGKNATLAEKDFKIAALTLELAYYRRIKFGKKSESFSGEQRELFEETIATDLAAVEPVFSHLRGQQGLNRFRRSGVKAVKRGFALHVLAYNLSRAVALLRALFVALFIAFSPFPVAVSGFCRRLRRFVIVFRQPNLTHAFTDMGRSAEFCDALGGRNLFHLNS